jgi:hypothetical protein
MKRYLKWSIWAYLILLIFEGALRKWVFPGAQEALLIVRDPLVMLIYALALGCGIVPRTRFMAVLGVLIVGSFIWSFLAGQSNVLVTLYGLRTNYLHVPLIWIMAEALDREDVERLGTFVLLVGIPMTILMVMQFRAPPNAYINRGVGSEEGGQLAGAAGRIRPPGFFAFITGPTVFFPLAAVYFLHQAVQRRRLIWPLLICAGGCIAIALPVSISRGTMLLAAAAAAVYIVGLVRLGLINASVFRFALTGAVLLVLLSFLPVFSEARNVFMSRWNTAAAESQGDAWGSLATRVLSGFSEPFVSAFNAPFFGKGIGVGSNVGARLLKGKLGFLLAENEFDKIFLELGPLLGGLFIAMRFAISIYLFAIAIRALLKNRDPLPLGLWAACVPAILLHQWAPPTFLGFAVFGGGLVMASVNYVDDEEEELEDEEEDDEEDDEEDEDEDDEDERPAPLSPVEQQRRRMRGL